MAALVKKVLDGRSICSDSLRLFQLQSRLSFGTTGSSAVAPRILAGGDISPQSQQSKKKWRFEATNGSICSRLLASSKVNTFLVRLNHKISEKADQEIYEGILSTQIKLVKTFSLMTSCIGLAFQPILYSYSHTGGNVAVVVATGAVISFFTLGTPLLIHSVSKKYVTKLYYNQVEDKYTAVVYNIFVRPKKIEFKLSDVNVPDIPGMFTTFKARNMPLFVEGSLFKEPVHFGKIMGYDKPLNLRWDADSDMTEAHAKKLKKK